MSDVDIFQNEGMCDAAWSHINCVERKEAQKRSKSRSGAKSLLEKLLLEKKRRLLQKMNVLNGLFLKMNGL